MRLFDFLYVIYFKLPSFYGWGILGKVYRHALTDSFKWFLTLFYRDRIRNSVAYEALDPEQLTYDKPIVVSLTSYQGRIDVVDIAVKCLLRQTVKANRIVIWLAVEEFTEDTLPESIRDLRHYGVEIRFCDNLLAHKKYFYALQEFTDSYIITFDDDFFFERNMIANAMELKLKHPDCITTNRAHLMRFQDGTLLPYRQWRHNTIYAQPAHHVFATGGVGTVYESHLLQDHIFDLEAIRQLSPRADDVWLKFMAYLNGVKVVTDKRYNKDFITLPESQKEQLVKSNVNEGGNDAQIRNMLTHYKINANSLLHSAAKSAHE